MFTKESRLMAGLMVLSLVATPAMASLFDFHVGSLYSTYDSGTGAFASSPILTLPTGQTTASVVRLESPAGSAQLAGPGLAGYDGNFSVSMAISSIVTDALHPENDRANGTGMFSLTDTTGDILSGNMVGTWTRTGPANTFAGTMSNITFSSLDGTFNGNSIIVPPSTIVPTSVSMVFSAPQPWSGALTQLSTTGIWFGDGSYTTDSGSLDASVVSTVPVPAALLLGFFGLGTAGLGLRKRM
jgi:hypothetical protein